MHVHRDRDEDPGTDLVRHDALSEFIGLERGIFVALDDDEILLIACPRKQVAILPLPAVNKPRTRKNGHYRWTYFGTNSAVAARGVLDLWRLECELEGAAMAVALILDECGFRHEIHWDRGRRSFITVIGASLIVHDKRRARLSQ